MTKPKLVIGSKAYSSWSLRPWMVLTHFGIPFEEVVVELDAADTRERLLGYSPSARAPVLIHDGVTIWDSLAIIEYVAETWPNCRSGLATRRRGRWRGRSAPRCTAGFSALRAHCPTQFARRPRKRALTSEVEADVGRIEEAWGRRAPASARAVLSSSAPFRPPTRCSPPSSTASRLTSSTSRRDAQLYGRDHGSAGMEGLDRRPPRPSRAATRLRKRSEPARHDGENPHDHAAILADGASSPTALEPRLWSDFYHHAMTASWPQFFGTLATAFVTLNAIFAVIYWLGEEPIANAQPGSFSDLFFFSVETTSTVGYGDMHPQTMYGHVVATVENFFGMLSLSRDDGAGVRALLATPRAPAVRSQSRRVRLRGRAHPCFPTRQRALRLHQRSDGATLDARASRNQGKATLRHVSADEVDQERKSSIRADLDAVPSLRPGQPAARARRRRNLVAASSILCLAFRASTRPSAQTVRARQAFAAQDIKFDHEFVDVIAIEPDGSRRVNYAMIHDVRSTV